MGAAVHLAGRVASDFCVYQRSFAFVQNPHVYTVIVAREEVHRASGYSCWRQGNTTTSIYQCLPEAFSTTWGKAYSRYDPAATQAFWLYASHPRGGTHGRDDSDVCQPWRAVRFRRSV